MQNDFINTFYEIRRETRKQDEELRVPDHVESAKEAMRVALDHQTVYVRTPFHARCPEHA